MVTIGRIVLARHTALLYYWIVIGLYLVSPKAAYNFMEQVEQHAYASYNKFLKEEETYLKSQPAPQIAIDYYRDGDLYMFDEFQTAHAPADRRPTIDNLYDVFVAIRDDEMEHVKTMVACQRSDDKNTLASPHTARVQLAGMETVALDREEVVMQ